MFNFGKNKKNNTTGTASISPNDSKKIKLYKVLKIWWPVAILLLIFVIAGFTKYIYNNNVIYSFTIDLIKSIGVLMIVMYVIYTRILSLETKRMAEASMGMYIAEKGTVLTEVYESTSDFSHLTEDVKKITQKIHINDKKISQDEFDSYKEQTDLPSVILVIKNICSRRIEASKIDFSVRHTGTTEPYDVSCDISKIGPILPWTDKEISLIVAPEGEIEIIVKSIDYVDGGIVQRVSVDEKVTLPRIRKPEKN